MRFGMEHTVNAYVDAMMERATDAHRELFRGITTLVYTDFPDYGNVGDSAIALGQLRFFRDVGIDLVEGYSYLSLDQARVVASGLPIVINGGGNIGGLYPLLDNHRYQLIDAVQGGATIVQSPQSLSFVDSQSKERFTRAFHPGSNTRFAARDGFSQRLAETCGVAATLAPDAVHFLGHIGHQGVPNRPYVELIRRDSESAIANTLDPDVPRSDWITDSFFPRARIALSRRLSNGAKRSASRTRDPEIWQSRGNQRLTRGIRFLSKGEFVVTDRLHGMLIGLQLGKHVIALDNSTRKLSAYAETWFQDVSVSLEFADSYEDARKMARRRVGGMR